MNEVLDRIAELETMKSVAERKGFVKVERWAMAELAEMKAIVKRGELNG
ncbi:hypothetical protein [Sporolactobacillus terrae]|uniref:Uncharacterized protein n=1 Tax=Sporolactobacillus terrae TaxID=269673 RepID=A0A5K7WYC2_9BACL|nr:hypothetical protein [Sporolactobacillus terrae]BBN97460.1 hypothetical protein St703_01650 [Sporolactobacillus terrae]